MTRPRATVGTLRLVRTPERRVAPGRAPEFDDSELLAAVAAGDGAAAASLYHRVRPTVDRALFQLLGANDRDHEDIAQLSILALIGSLQGFRGECSLDTWTSRITAHTAWKELRRRRSSGRMREHVRAIESTRQGVAEIGRAVAMRDILGRVQRHIDALDEVKAWTVILHDVCGYDLREIAEITEATIAAAQSRLVRGRAELQARLEADPELADALEAEPVSERQR